VLRWAADTAAVWKACTKKLSAISRQLSVGSRAPLARAGLFCFVLVHLQSGYVPSVPGFYVHHKIFAAARAGAHSHGSASKSQVPMKFQCVAE
jgi:hypothetical protein